MSQSAIAFSRIPQGNLVPLFYVEFSNVNAGINLTQQPSLLVGQMQTGVGTATPGVPVFVASTSQARGLFGPRSMLGRKCITYLKQDPSGVWAMPVADATGSVAATAPIVMDGTATGAGAIPLYVGGINIPVGVNVGDTVTEQAGNIAAAINAQLDLPVTATSATGTVTLAATHKGALGNQIDIRLAYYGLQAGEVMPAGTSATITPFSSGATDPDMAQLGAAIGDVPYDFIGTPYAVATQLAEYTSIMNDASGRWAWNRQDYGSIFTMQNGTLSSLLTTAGTINDQHTVIVGVDDSPNPPWDWTADWMGACAVSIRNLASRPLQTLQMQTVLAPAQGDWWGYPAAQQLLSYGIAVPGFSNYGPPQIVRCVTTYKFNQYGVQDESYQDVETLYTLMAITRRAKAAITQDYPRAILVPNGTPAGPGSPFVTPNDLKATLTTAYNLMQSDGLVTSAAIMIAGTVVQINQDDPRRCDILWTPALANGLRMVGMVNQFILNSATA